MRAALYLRRSTLDLQPESLVAQEEVLRSHAAAHELLVVDVFRDSASGRSAKRKGFQQLVHVIDAGAPFDAVLVRDVSRFGRFAMPDEHAYWEFRFLLKGVRVLYVEEPFPENDASPYAVLMKDLKRVLASEFSTEKAERTTAAQARVVQRGFVHGGTAPYGLRRILVTLDGTYASELPRGQRKATSTHRVKFAPANPTEVAVVQRIFALYARGMNTPGIAALDSLPPSQIPQLASP